MQNLNRKKCSVESKEKLTCFVSEKKNAFLMVKVAAP